MSPVLKRPRPRTRTGSDCGSTSASRARLPAGSVRKRDEISRREDRRTRQDRAGRVLLWLCNRHRGAAPVPEPRLRRGRRQEMGPEALLQRSHLLPLKRSGEAVPRRHVLRLLPRRADSDTSAGRSRASRMGKPQLERRRPVFLDRPHLFVGSRRRAASPTSCSTRLAPARSTPRWSRPTTSTTRAR